MAHRPPGGYTVLTWADSQLSFLYFNRDVLHSSRLLLSSRAPQPARIGEREGLVVTVNPDGTGKFDVRHVVTKLDSSTGDGGKERPFIFEYD